MSSVALDRSSFVMPERAPDAPAHQAQPVRLQSKKSQRTTKKTQNIVLSILRIAALIPAVSTAVFWPLSAFFAVKSLFTKKNADWDHAISSFNFGIPLVGNYLAWSTLLEKIKSTSR
jgi:hypothetical protein